MKSRDLPSDYVYLAQSLESEKETTRMLDAALKSIFVALGLKAPSRMAPILTWQDAVDEIERLRAMTMGGKRFRHVRGGPEYEVIGKAAKGFAGGAELTICRMSTGQGIAWETSHFHAHFVPAPEREAEHG